MVPAPATRASQKQFSQSPRTCRPRVSGCALPPGHLPSTEPYAASPMLPALTSSPAKLVRRAVGFCSVSQLHPGTQTFPGQGLHLSRSCNLCGSCDNARSLTPLLQAGDGNCASVATRAAAVEFFTHCTMVGTPVSETLNQQALEIVWESDFIA